MKNTNRCALSLLLCILSTSSAEAGLGSFLKDAAKVVTAPVTVPAKTMVNAAQAVIGAKPASAILDPTKDASGATGRVLTQGIELAGAPRDFVLQKTQELAAKAGPAGSVIYDVATLSNRIADELATSAAFGVANVLQGKNPLIIVASPLAAAIRDARARHISTAKPLPPDVINGLKPFFQEKILQRARYTVGKLEISLPNGIGKTTSFMGGANAVVVDDVIVFPYDPGTFADSAWWWGHEVTHVEQYTEWGVDDFAFRYVRSGGKEAEEPAHQRGDKVAAHAVSSGASSNAQMQKLSAVHQSGAMEKEGVVGPMVPESVIKQMVPEAMGDPTIIQCVFPYHNTGLSFYGTKLGRIIVVDPRSGQWVHVGFALPPHLAGVSWHYSAGTAFYDVLQSGQIMMRTFQGPVQVGHVIPLQDLNK